MPNGGRGLAVGSGRATRSIGYALLVPLGALVLGLVLVPVATFFYYSFLKPGLFFSTVPGFTLGNYAEALSNDIYRRAELNSIQIGLATAFATVVLGYVLAYYLSVRAGPLKRPLLALTVASILGVYLIRIYAWRTILGNEGILRSVLGSVGTGLPADFLLFSKTAVVIGLVNFYIPFAALVLFAAIENIPRDLLEAARDLGATPVTAFRRVTLPLTGPACFYAFLFVFLLSAADFVTPELLGGAAGSTIGTVVRNQFLLAGNWPVGAALSFSLVGVLGVVLVVTWVVMKLVGILPRRA